MSEQDGPGKPPHEPTEENRITVAKMSAYGMTQDVISKCIGVSEPTLRLYYREELDTAKAKCITEVADRLMDKIRNGDGPSIMFYLKTQGKWREQDKDNKEGGESALEKALNKIPDAVKP